MRNARSVSIPRVDFDALRSSVSSILILPGASHAYLSGTLPGLAIIDANSGVTLVNRIDGLEVAFEFMEYILPAEDPGVCARNIL